MGASMLVGKSVALWRNPWFSDNQELTVHIRHTRSQALRPVQLLATLVTTALATLGAVTLPSLAAAPTLTLAITPDETSYLSGVE